MSGFKAIDEIERIDRAAQEIAVLRQEANQLAENYVPGIYADGDVRKIPKAPFRRMQAMLAELNERGAFPDKLRPDAYSRPGYQGQYGLLIFEEADE